MMGASHGETLQVMGASHDTAPQMTSNSHEVAPPSTGIHHRESPPTIGESVQEKKHKRPRPTKQLRERKRKRRTAQRAEQQAAIFSNRITTQSTNILQGAAPRMTTNSCEAAPQDTFLTPPFSLNLMLKTQDGLTVGNVLRGLNILDQGRECFRSRPTSESGLYLIDERKIKVCVCVVCCLEIG